MKKGYWLTASLIVGLLLSFPRQVGADDSELRSGITMQGGFYTPSLEMTSDGSFEVLQNSLDSRSVTSGENPYTAAIGVGIISKNASGFASRLAYQYRRESEMVYTVSSVEDFEIVYPEGERPRFKYSLHTLSLSLMKHIKLVPSNLSIYLGGGLGGVLLVYPEENRDTDHSIGITGFPLVGLEIMLGEAIGLYSEFQYHWGRTLDQEYDYEDGTSNATIDYHYSLKGTHWLGGINLYF